MVGQTASYFTQDKEIQVSTFNYARGDFPRNNKTIHHSGRLRLKAELLCSLRHIKDIYLYILSDRKRIRHQALSPRLGLWNAPNEKLATLSALGLLQSLCLSSVNVYVLLLFGRGCHVFLQRGPEIID
jgi:hypothetical protein